ncbi:MAG: tetratricopeptide repeat protein, partial [Pseudomonadota bacterium]
MVQEVGQRRLQRLQLLLGHQWNLPRRRKVFYDIPDRLSTPRSAVILGRLDEAIASYTRAIKLGPKEAELRYVLGIALNRRGRFEESIASWKAALKIDANYLTAHTALAWHLATAPEPNLHDA